MEAGAVHDSLCGDEASARLDLIAVAGGDEALDLRVEAHLAASVDDELGEGVAHAAVVDDAGLRNAQGADAGRVRLDLGQGLGA